MTMMPQEQEMRQLVRETLNQAGQIDNGRLAQLMPTIPKRKRPFWRTITGNQLPRQLAMVTMLCVLLLGSWHWLNDTNAAVWPTQPTSIAVTATTTFTPTATQTQAKITATETAVGQQPLPTIVQTPAPLPTPITAVTINAN